MMFSIQKENLLEGFIPSQTVAALGTTQQPGHSSQTLATSFVGVTPGATGQPVPAVTPTSRTANSPRFQVVLNKCPKQLNASSTVPAAEPTTRHISHTARDCFHQELAGLLKGAAVAIQREDWHSKQNNTDAYDGGTM
ncbi:ABC transporter substrate-binding protein [Anopheles sinensis]|uniref:ABC transporter substrate-binding protein n=1 Tax=Anopheles sinensis TaxID=74873 RepID=A0A084WUR4_ANOSI|nr:ABC transporter substrate-binding protein [Anopheles sinensis]